MVGEIRSLHFKVTLIPKFYNFRITILYPVFRPSIVLFVAFKAPLGVFLLFS